ncbi:DMT family transporter [Vibrio mimicus]|uniref:DMT family transporter n=1 Tax=Vibrio mimicus TaxID=674 RepID=UPI0011DAEADC|nr:DMT family transporter [Vibrio mimicus]TXY02829.1 DMT family transporter [Vibrio mimicus]TXY46442.1 DMT family transporter [Vibrio mimicus]
MLKYKEIIAFCIFFSLSFVFMSKVVKSVDPIVSTFITYGLAAAFFFMINLKSRQVMWEVLVSQKKLVIKINLSTLINTVLAFYVVIYISPIAYIMVFFSGLSFFNMLHNRKEISHLEISVNIVAMVLAIAVSFLISDADPKDTVIGLGLTLISTLFGAFYMRESANLHKETGISASQILSVRFFFVIILCGIYSLFVIGQQGIAFNDLALLCLIAVTGSIVPLFLMQKSIKKLGAKVTAQFTPLTPILCLLFMTLVENQRFSVLEISLTLLIALTMLYQATLKTA